MTITYLGTKGFQSDILFIVLVLGGGGTGAATERAGSELTDFISSLSSSSSLFDSFSLIEVNDLGLVGTNGLNTFGDSSADNDEADSLLCMLPADTGNTGEILGSNPFALGPEEFDFIGTSGADENPIGGLCNGCADDGAVTGAGEGEETFRDAGGSGLSGTCSCEYELGGGGSFLAGDDGCCCLLLGTNTFLLNGGGGTLLGADPTVGLLGSFGGGLVGS